ncbi:MAG: alkaline phosphatase family protein [Caldilineales bacterium]|nr:alkaline phosphatase family protein [Caldilineales bacterium]
MSGTLAFNQPVVKPDYDDGCFADIPGLVGNLLGLTPPGKLSPGRLGHPERPFDQVVVLLADAFGWRFFEQFSDHPGLQHFIRHGYTHKLTSQFPSTTTAHVTTMCTGQAVGQHGLFEWQYYEPQLDAMIVPLLFSFAGEEQPELLRLAKVDPRWVLPRQTWFQTLQTQGVDCRAILPKDLAKSTYTSVMTQGATVAGYKTLPEALINLRRQIDRTSGPALHYLYYPSIDSISHDYGPESEQVAAEIDAFLTALDRWFFAKLGSGRQNTAFLLIADHGQIAVDPATTLYLNLLPEFEVIRPWLQTDKRGKLLTPGGSARDMFLYVKDGSLDEVHPFLSDLLEGRADVVKVADLIAAGYFGPTPQSDIFLSHVGNLVILPHAKESVWWYEDGRFEQKFFGHHGGLSAEEMEIPLLMYTL